MIELIIFMQVVLVIGVPLFLLHINKRVGSYASEVGKITAIGEKIDDVVEQQKQITKATENTKSNIAHLAWNKKEAQTIKRNKLENYLEEIFEAFDTVYQHVDDLSKPEMVEFKNYPVMLIPKLTTIQMLYLPELEEENKAFTDLLKKHDADYNNYVSKKIEKDEFVKKMMENFSLFGSTMKAITLKSKHVIEVMFNS